MAVVVFREKVLQPILAGPVARRHGHPPENRDPLDEPYQAIRDEMEQILQGMEPGGPPGQMASVPLSVIADTDAQLGSLPPEVPTRPDRTELGGEIPRMELRPYKLGKIA